MQSSLWWLGALAPGNEIGLFCSLRIATTIFRQPEKASGWRIQAPDPVAYTMLLVLSTVFLVMGIFPAPLINQIEMVVADQVQ